MEVSFITAEMLSRTETGLLSNLVKGLRLDSEEDLVKLISIKSTNFTGKRYLFEPLVNRQLSDATIEAKAEVLLEVLVLIGKDQDIERLAGLNSADFEETDDQVSH